MNHLSRREMLGALLILPLASALGASARTAATSGRRTLVAYFSRSGNTRVIAGQIHRARASDLFEIVPATPYPDDYEQTVEQARRERDAGYEPRLKSTVADIASYETVFLGFPIWGETAPPVIRSFLTRHNLSGKTLIPFVTHGGYGLGSSLSVLARYAPGARLIEGLTMEADQERRTLNTVTQWLGTVRVPAS
jgi:flavodoxin